MMVSAQVMSLGSTVGIAKLGTKSLRATVPEGIVAYLELKAGDKLEWKMSSNEDGERITIVRKLKSTKGERATKPKRR
jgi:bifunctional DNA-binding transcriptional regulator/antitoxin component of YhaV-PrlF toxin-antitoxin module